MNKYRECPVCTNYYAPPSLCDGGPDCHAVKHGCPHRKHPMDAEGRPQPMIHRFCPTPGCGHYRTDPLHTAPALAALAPAIQRPS